MQGNHKYWRYTKTKQILSKTGANQILLVQFKIKAKLLITVGNNNNN